MKQQVILFAIAICTLSSGCSVPDKPALRIAVSTTPGSAVLYLAQEAGLFRQYGVNVQIVELSSGCECSMALADGQVDAVAIPYGELLAMREGSASMGILMLLAASNKQMPEYDHVDHNLEWFQGDIEVLTGRRSDLMLRRRDWQQVLLAYEHARLLLTGEREKHAAIIAQRESRSPEEFISDLQRWSLFGVADQDSLLGDNGPFSAMKAHWQGRKFLTAAATSKLFQDRESETVTAHGSGAK